MPYPIHEKYDLQEVFCVQIQKKNVVVIITQRLQRDDEEINVDVPTSFLHQPWKKNWLLIKGPTSKYYVNVFYTALEKVTTGRPQKNIIAWLEFLERSCNDPDGKVPFHKIAKDDNETRPLEKTSFQAMTYLRHVNDTSSRTELCA